MNKKQTVINIPDTGFNKNTVKVENTITEKRVAKTFGKSPSIIQDIKIVYKGKLHTLKEFMYACENIYENIKCDDYTDEIAVRISKVNWVILSSYAYDSVYNMSDVGVSIDFYVSKDIDEVKILIKVLSKTKNDVIVQSHGRDISMHTILNKLAVLNVSNCEEREITEDLECKYINQSGLYLIEIAGVYTGDKEYIRKGIMEQGVHMVSLCTY